MLTLYGSFLNCLQSLVIWISNICIKKIYFTKSNFPSKRDFKSDEDQNKHPLDICEEIVKFCHTLIILLVYYIYVYYIYLFLYYI